MNASRDTRENLNSFKINYNVLKKIVLFYGT